MFFFFQAEDGIRDYKVTGVQTCALPISTLHCASCGGPKPLASVSQIHGWTWKPANTGPPMGWLVTVIVAAEAPFALAESTLAPGASPATRPMKRPLARTANDEVTFRPPTSMRTLAASTPAGTTTSTSASPPEIRSARFDSTLISSVGGAAPAGVSAGGAMSIATAMRSDTTGVRFKLSMNASLSTQHSELPNAQQNVEDP